MPQRVRLTAAKGVEGAVCVCPFYAAFRAVVTKDRWRPSVRNGIPIRGTFANRSVPAIASALTRVMIDPTVRQATRISSRTAVLEQHTVNWATVSSKAYVCPAPWRAQRLIRHSLG
jgi:hypothetical protein